MCSEALFPPVPEFKSTRRQRANFFNKHQMIFPYGLWVRVPMANGSFSILWYRYPFVSMFKTATKSLNFLKNGASLGSIRGITVQNEIIYLSSRSSLYVYSPDGNLLRSWPLKGYPGSTYGARHLATYQDRLFMCDNNYKCITVFGIQDGKIVNEWEVSACWNIAVTSTALYAVNFKDEIQAWTHQGECLFTSHCDTTSFRQIAARDDQLYITDNESNVHIFKITYS